MASDPTVKDDRLWHDKYNIRKGMVPSFLTEQQANKVRIVWLAKASHKYHINMHQTSLQRANIDSTCKWLWLILPQLGAFVSSRNVRGYVVLNGYGILLCTYKEGYLL